MVVYSETVTIGLLIGLFPNRLNWLINPPTAADHITGLPDREITEAGHIRNENFRIIIKAACWALASARTMSHFLNSFIPKREEGNSTAGIIAALKSLTLIQLAQFFSG